MGCFRVTVLPKHLYSYLNSNTTSPFNSFVGGWMLVVFVCKLDNETHPFFFFFGVGEGWGYFSSSLPKEKRMVQCDF
jgi:hypothetical protein